MAKEILEKEKKIIGNTTMYLIGTDKEGVKYYLKAPAWDCDWYWGFGYIEGFSKSRVHISHEHATNFYRFCEERLIATTFTDDEFWELCTLFDNFYTLKNLAETQAHEGREGNYSHKYKGFDYRTLIKDGLDINKDCIPQVMTKIIYRLTPDIVKPTPDDYKRLIKKRGE